MMAITVTVKLFLIAMVTFSAVYLFLEKDALKKSWTVLKARMMELLNIGLDTFTVTHNAIVYITKTFGQIFFVATKAALQLTQLTMKKSFSYTQNHIAEMQTPIRIQTRKMKMNMNLLAKKFAERKTKLQLIEKENILLTSKNAELKQELEGIYEVWTKTMAQLELTEKKYRNLMIYSNAVTTSLRKSLTVHAQKNKAVSFVDSIEHVRGFKNPTEVNSYVKGLVDHELIGDSKMKSYSNKAASQSTAAKEIS